MTIIRDQLIALYGEDVGLSTYAALRRQLDRFSQPNVSFRVPEGRGISRLAEHGGESAQRFLVANNAPAQKLSSGGSHAAGYAGMAARSAGNP